MTVPRFLLGVVLLVVALGPVAAGAWGLRARLLGWTGVPARIAEVVIGLSAVVVVSEALGVVGWYRTAPMVIGLAAVGAGTWWWSTRRPRHRRPDADAAAGPIEDRGPGDPAPVQVLGRWGTVLMVVVLSVLVADWAPRIVDAYHHGMTTIDTLWYHLPMALRFVQTGHVGRVQYFDGDAITAFYPGNAELVHGLGILTLGSDLLSPMVDFLWLALALLSAWSIGRRAGLAPLTVSGAAVVFATPGLVATQPGGAYTDVVTIALLLAAFAILVEAHRREVPPVAAYGLAGLAAGLALGTKFTMLIPVAAMTVGVVLTAPRRQRLRHTEAWVVGLVVTGAFWYFRNIVTAGNPLPSLGFKIGPINVRNLSNERATVSSVSHYLFDGHVWNLFLAPGLTRSLGWAWGALLALVLVGLLAAAAIGPTRPHRLLAFVGLATIVGYLFTQQILGPPGEPVYFGVNVRYMAPGLVLGLVALPSAGLRWPRLCAPILGAYVAILGLLQLDPTLWPSHVFKLSFAPPIAGVDAVLGLLVGICLLAGGLVVVLAGDRLGPPRSRGWPVAAGIGALVILGGALVTPYYQQHRYSTMPFLNWASDLHDQRIGLYGPYTFVQYPASGRTLTNHVQYLGERGEDGSYGPITDCASWRRIVDAGHYDDLLVAGDAGHPPPEFAWTTAGTSATRGPVLAAPPAVVFHLHGPLDPDTCPAPPPAPGG
jgi:hypothetical protein